MIQVADACGKRGDVRQNTLPARKREKRWRAMIRALLARTGGSLDCLCASGVTARLVILTGLQVN